MVAAAVAVVDIISAAAVLALASAEPGLPHPQGPAAEPPLVPTRVATVDVGAPAAGNIERNLRRFFELKSHGNQGNLSDGSDVAV